MSEDRERPLVVLRDLEAAEATQLRAERACQAGVGNAARARAVLDAVHDSARGLLGRNREVRASATSVRDSLERARLATLNAGLEGARLGEPLGKAVVVMADDMRALLSRAQDALDEHLGLLGEVERERERWLEELAQSRELCGAAVQALDDLYRLEASVAEAIGRLGQSLRRHVGAEPERARLVSDAAEQTRALVESLARLTALGAGDDAELRALLEPLSALLSRTPVPP